ncbi:MAG: radical SAM protein [Candidatus Alcyoniella australis]|nr:radical SAM protein [Candidatus Alcyoniella australis]
MSTTIQSSDAPLGVQRTVLLARPAQPASRPLNNATNRVPPMDLKAAEALLATAGYRPLLVDGMAQRRGNRAIVRMAELTRPAWALLSMLEFQQNDLPALDKLTRDLARLGCKVLLAGHYPSFAPQAALDQLSAANGVLRGEPEQALLEVIGADALSTEPIAGLVTRENPQAEIRIVPKLDALPDPLWAPRDVLRYFQRYPLLRAIRPRWGSIMASRGCPRGCTFCSPFSRVSFGADHRRYDPARVESQARNLARVGANMLSFEDDAFTTNRQWTLDVYRRLRPLGLGFIHHARADELDYELMQRMREAGGILLKVGVESGSPRVIESMGKAANGEEWVADVQRLGQDCERLGIGLCAMFIVGCPGETEQDLEQSLALARHIKPELLQIHFFTAYPGSAEYERMSADQRPEPSALHHYAPGQGGDEIAARVSRMARGFFLRPSFVLRHLRRHVGFYLRNPGTAWGLLRGFLGLGS